MSHLKSFCHLPDRATRGASRRWRYPLRASLCTQAAMTRRRVAGMHHAPPPSPFRMPSPTTIRNLTTEHRNSAPPSYHSPTYTPTHPPPPPPNPHVSTHSTCYTTPGQRHVTH